MEGSDERFVGSTEEAMRELEFVESLASPYNIHLLAVGGSLFDPSFIEYLGKLSQRWSQGRWAAALRFPNSAFNLRMLATDAAFRQRALSVDFSTEMIDLQRKDQHLTP